MTRESSRPALYIVAAIAVLNVVAFTYAIWHVISYGYLPPPYFAAPRDTFMDFYDTNYWAYHADRYTEWLTIYPIFTFLLAYAISPRSCYLYDAYWARSCDDVSLAVFFAVYVIAVYLNARLFSEKWLPRVLCFWAIALSYPMVFEIDRGNYLLFAYAFLVLALSAKSRFTEGLFVAAAINIKPYLAVLLPYAVLKGDYRTLSACALSGMALFGIAALYMAEPKFSMFIDNLFLFTEASYLASFIRIQYSLSVNTLVTFAKRPDADFLIELLRDQYPIFSTELMLLTAQVLGVLLLGMVAVVAYGLIRKHSQIEKEFICYASLVCLLNLSEAPGVYALILLLPYLARMYRSLSAKELVALLILFLPFDGNMFHMYDPFETQVSHITGQPITVSLTLMYGSMFRPLAMLFLLICLVLWAIKGSPAPSDRSAAASPGVTTMQA
jgi:hypothetical protein